jgi:heme-degrading monooxygenase HmoA
MILEVAMLNVRQGQETKFEAAFSPAETIIGSVKGHIAHQLQRCVEQQRKYLLLVQWERLEDHTEGFRGSPQYQEWKGLLHRFYDSFPSIEHYAFVLGDPLAA